MSAPEDDPPRDQSSLAYERRGAFPTTRREFGWWWWIVPLVVIVAAVSIYFLGLWMFISKR